ncbi:Variable outer membrane protein (plasmid) [Borrelia nietonii YOR]|uniref:Variable large protein n=2 Tax=Borrelia TaxID=138 RepID=W5SAY3_9SPIR|nr:MULTISPECIES: variable large family protein [Borrelia]AHH04259.1 Variable outer membrane protein [Borrelia nietonii YOR]AHH14785.1 Variable outer membrane protein [Borrelia hermsii MTW]
MAKDGKFANDDNAANTREAIKNATVSAVTKTLDALTIAIRNTINAGLKQLKTL